MEKHIICLAVSLMIFFFSPAHAFTLTFENNTDRAGCDYTNFVVPPANFPYAACMNACGLDSTCQAWNFDPTSGTPLCFLKNCVPAPSVHNGAVGGVKLPATMSDFENDIDRVGCDYENFVGPNPQFCMTQCGLDASCQAWNFDPRLTLTCFLKTCVPAPTPSVGLTGGVKFSK